MATGIVLVENGESQYHIVIAGDAIASERYAAEELQRYLERMSGARLPIVTDAQSAATHEILLGDNARARQLCAKLDLSKLGTDGFALRTEANRLVIAGGKPRGVLYGVYEVLEKLGVRWYTPEVEFVPKRSTVTLPELDEIQTPAFESREVYWTVFIRDGDFAARHRLNGNHYRLTEKHGGRFAVYHPFVHSFDALIPPELCNRHPEFWPYFDGKRQSGYVQRCLTNPDLLKHAIAKVRQWIREHPEANVISVSQNDAYKYCQCPKCRALDDAEGSPCATLLQFVNAIAADIEKDYPNVRIDTLAYQYTRKPPKTIRPHHNVVVRLCSIECCFAHPLETCPSEENRSFRNDIVTWQTAAPTPLYIWDYTTNFRGYQQPFPNFDVLQANVQFFRKHGVKGLFEQGNYSRGGRGEMEPLRAYLLAKLLWNPDCDIKKHTDDFLCGYYGNAAEPIRAYMELLHRQVREKGHHAHIFDAPDAPYLTDELLAGAERLFDEAERLADNDDVRFRVQVARLPIWFVKLATNRVTGQARVDLLQKFLAIARKAGITEIREGRPLDESAKELGAK